ncbi:TPA: hypothetical protein PIT68_000219 [Klebsiella quasipneumoniae subsp. similipneumoniae]|uniref:Uncharacterized protein n=1 Tax=Klebsiella spallanzanii TaxID=2587528 RepID=A0A564NFT1_9ENTR|nr:MULTISPECIES: hypothetical protein [Klebsiella]ELT0794712.1 hypothetical protein [Klebsiella quasipneumoniae]MCM5920049.1 hypothetical protein [Klebsiella pneumoniae]MCS6401568.1 hypothetical protein [Klebsiella quasipneumoniae subsp. similipneumoniae]MCS6434681.1 hypothetical protein [Klebsiella pneumoniae]MDV1058909.1 hypothetical protein [Klebsiella quasipneumoniae subsp. similipneumoniae]
MNAIQNVVENALQGMETSGNIVERDGPDFGITVHHDQEAYKKVLKQRKNNDNDSEK